MMKAAYRADFLTISRKELIEEAEKFLLKGRFHKDVPDCLTNINSPQFGSSDLLFVDREKTNVTVARVNIARDCEKFVVVSVSYYFWLKDFIAVSESFFSKKCGLEMHLFSSDFSSVRCLLEHLTEDLRIHLIQYNLLRLEDSGEPVIYFQEIFLPRPVTKIKKRREETLAPAGDEEVPDSLRISKEDRISKEELREFNRLQALYLPDLEI